MCGGGGLNGRSGFGRMVPHTGACNPGFMVSEATRACDICPNGRHNDGQGKFMNADQWCSPKILQCPEGS